MRREVRSYEREEIERRADDWIEERPRQELLAIAAGIGFGVLLLSGIALAIAVVL